MITMHRVFAVILIAFASVWILAMVMLRREIAADSVFYAQQVAPYFEATKRQTNAFHQALQDRREGKQVPLPLLQPLSTAPFDEWVKRLDRRYHYISIRDVGQIGFMGTAALWVLATLIQVDVRRRRWESPGRPAVSNAGKLIGDLVQSGGVFIAKAANGAGASEVEIDGGRARVIFRHFAFISAFVGNPTRDCTKVLFTDLIAGSLSYSKGRSFLRLRTTHGKVVISDSVQPFQKLADLLLDTVELNRTSPDQYRATLAHEPQIRIPWYGWMIIATALAVIAMASWWALRN